MDLAKKTGRLLQNSKYIHSAWVSLKGLLVSAEKAWKNHPERDPAAAAREINHDSKTLRNLLAASSLKPDHPLRDQTNAVLDEAAELTFQMGKPVVKDDKSAMKPGAAASGYKRAALTVPTFSGHVSDFHSFWKGFKQSVHDATDLTKPAKMAYLREAQKDSSVYRQLDRYTDEDDSYDKAVAELHSQFDKPRLLHQLYLQNIIDQPPVPCNRQSLAEYATLLRKSEDGLNRLKQSDGRFILTSLAVKHIPDKVRTAWEDATDDCKTVPPVNDLIEFIRKKADNPMYNTKDDGLRRPQGDRRPPKHQGKPKGSAHVAVSQPATPEVQHTPATPSFHSKGSGNKSKTPHQSGNRYSCPLCTELHYCYACTAFKKLSVSKRKEYVNNQGLCFLCLKPGHSSEECRAQFSCRVCEGTHNTLIHADHTPPQPATANLVATNTLDSLGRNKILMTCQALATGPTGKSMPIRGLLDTGADVSVVTKKVAKYLSLKKLETTIAVSSYGDVVTEKASPTVSLTIDAIHSEPWRAQLAAVVTEKITGCLPRQSAAAVRDLPCLQGVKLADSTFDAPGDIDLLLGIDILPQILMGGESEQPLGVWKTKLGGVVMGTYEDSNISENGEASIQVIGNSPQKMIK